MAKSRERTMGTPAMRSLHLLVSISAIRTEATSNRARRAHRCPTPVRPTVGGTAVASRLVDVAVVVGWSVMVPISHRGQTTAMVFDPRSPWIPIRWMDARCAT
jgi:hypothetical protein